MNVARSNDRYARHRAIAGFSQEALQASRFAVIGAGAIGNEVVKNLCLLGVGAIDVYDLDTVERHNLTRSVLLREADVAAGKAERVAARARALDPAVIVMPVDGDIHETLDVPTTRGYRAVIGALDNFEARLRLNLVCWLAGTDWVNAGIDSRHVSVESFPFGSAQHDAPAPACYECGLPPSVYRRIAERYSCGGLQRAAALQRTVPTTAITASIAGAQAVNLALSPSPGSRRWLFDTGSGHAATARLSPADGCPACGEWPRSAPIVRVPDATAQGLAAAARRVGADSLRLADPLVWRCACPACGPNETTRAAELRAARTVSDAITHCPACAAPSVRVDLCDWVTPDDLAARFAEHPTRRVATRFALAADHCIALPRPPLEDRDERPNPDNPHR